MHIKDSLGDRGYDDADAEEIAARAFEQLCEEARKKGVRGWSRMSKHELERAVGR
ncbi:MAG: hypothetical protein WEC34_07475 [Acidimicrobiia bacterium]